jgi:hypothetical protein
MEIMATEDDNVEFYSANGDPNQEIIIAEDEENFLS